MGLNAEQETEAIETTLRRLRAEARKAEAEARKAEADAAERDDDALGAELARLRELRDAVRAWATAGCGTDEGDRFRVDGRLVLACLAFDRAEREATL